MRDESTNCQGPDRPPTYLIAAGLPGSLGADRTQPPAPSTTQPKRIFQGEFKYQPFAPSSPETSHRQADYPHPQVSHPFLATCLRSLLP